MTVTGNRYEQRFRVSWGHVDGNAHMANTAFLDRAADTRFLFFAEHGFPAARFIAERVGPVIGRDELSYRKELRLLDEFTVDLEMVGLSPDGTRFELSNTFLDGTGEVAAVVTSEGVLVRSRQAATATPAARTGRRATRNASQRTLQGDPLSAALTLGFPNLTYRLDWALCSHPSASRTSAGVRSQSQCPTCTPER